MNGTWDPTKYGLRDHYLLLLFGTMLGNFWVTSKAAPDRYVYEPYSDILVEENFVSPTFDESVIGFPEDRHPTRSGIVEMLAVVHLLETAGIPCCAVAESALIYYGTGRLRNDWVICVPNADLDKASAIIRSHDTAYSPFRPSALKAFRGMHHLYPQFKFIGVALFFVLTTAQECHIRCSPENFERSKTGIPYPKLSIHAQSLLDTNNLVDLDDLVDGMNLSVEWGLENLQLGGLFDAGWGRWKIETHRQAGASGLELLLDLESTGSRRETWEHTASAEQKKKRQGWKLLANRPTRFWHEGQKDPRLQDRDFC